MSPRRAALAALLVLTTEVAGRPIAMGPQLDVSPGRETSQVDVAGTDGVVLVTFFDTFGSGPFQALARRLDPSGLPLGPDFPIDPGGPLGSAPDVTVTANGDFLVMWFRDGDLVARRFDTAGNALGAVYAVPAGTYELSHSDVHVGASGAGLAVWGEHVDDDHTQIRGRFLDADGQPVGSDLLLVDAFENDLVFDVQVAVAPTGGFTVAWYWRDAVSPFAIHSRVRTFDALGAPLGSAIDVSSLNDRARGPRIAYGADGRFVVTFGQLADTVVRAATRVFDASGAPAGDDVVLGATHSPPVPIAALPGGGYVATWSERLETRVVLYGQLLDADGAPIGVRYRVDQDVKTGNLGTGGLAMGTDGQHVVVWNPYLEGGGSCAGCLRPSLFARAFGRDVPIAGQKLVYRDPTGVPTARVLVVQSTSKAVAPAVAGGVDPLATGLSLQLYAPSGESSCMTLPAAGWTISGKPERPTYKYADRSFAFGPCTSAVLKGAKLKIACRGAGIGFTLDEPSQGALSVDVGDGDARYCARFGGRIAADLPGRFQASGAPPPATCPVPPAACTP